METVSENAGNDCRGWRRKAAKTHSRERGYGFRTGMNRYV